MGGAGCAFITRLAAFSQYCSQNGKSMRTRMSGTSLLLSDRQLGTSLQHSKDAPNTAKTAEQ